MYSSCVAIAFIVSTRWSAHSFTFSSISVFGFVFSRDFLAGVPLVMGAIVLYGNTCDALCHGGTCCSASAVSVAEGELQQQRLLDEDDEAAEGASPTTPRPSRQ